MDQFTRSYTKSSSSSSYEQQHKKYTLKSLKPSYPNSLHLVHRPLPLRKPTVKHFIAPLPPTPLKIYYVKPSNFKEVVRMLTCTPEFKYPASSRLKDKAPPPLVLSTVSKPSLSPKPTTQPPPSQPLDGLGWSPDGLGLSPKPVGHDPSGGALMSPMGLGLSPASFSWCSSVLFSPGTHSAVNQSSVL